MIPCHCFCYLFLFWRRTRDFQDASHLRSSAPLSVASNRSLLKSLLGFFLYARALSGSSPHSFFILFWRRTRDFQDASHLRSSAPLSVASNRSLLKSLLGFFLYARALSGSSPHSFFFLFWRRTRDSNPRGCYALLDFQSSSLATRSILHAIIKYHIIAI